MIWLVVGYVFKGVGVQGVPLQNHPRLVGGSCASLEVGEDGGGFDERVICSWCLLFVLEGVQDVTGQATGAPADL